MVKPILLAWLGNTDLRASESNNETGFGLIAEAVRALPFERIVLISNYPEEKYQPYQNWLDKQTTVPIEIHYAELSRPTHYEEIYKAALKVVENSLEKYETKAKLTFHLSPGTPAMTAIWTKGRERAINPHRRVCLFDSVFPFLILDMADICYIFLQPFCF